MDLNNNCVGSSTTLSFASLTRSIYKYELNECDQEFIDQFFTSLPRLKDIWDRIGFNSATQLKRLGKFYSKMMVRHRSIQVSSFNNT